MVFTRKILLNPKYWILVFFLSIFWLLTRFPYSWQIRFGRKLGPGLVKLYTRARFTITKNIELCFPALSDAEKLNMVDDSSRELGVSIMETFLVWFHDLDRLLSDRVELEGESNFKQAVSQERGIILLSSHYGSVDMNGALAATLDRNDKSFIATYRQTDEAINEILQKVRGKFCDRMLSSTNQRAIAKALKNGEIIWYAPDIEVKGKGAVYADFMGVAAHTTTAISRLAKISDALVLPITHYRTSDDPQYRLKIFPALTDFPSGDLEKDTRRINQAIEEMIQPHPERYLWVIKRFKQQPNGVSPY
jgi:KDO2-lipid IV(A) lauroyltransferase